MTNFFRVISWLIADVIFINMAFYSAYLIRFKGVIEMPAFIPYLHLWLYICFIHLIIFSIFQLYEQAPKISKKTLFINVFNASLISALASVTILYMMRRFWGFIPSGVFILAGGFNIILSGGWRIFIRHDS